MSEHTPSIPLKVDMGWFDNKKKDKLCVNCGARLPEDEQQGSDYYHCTECGYVSLESTTD